MQLTSPAFTAGTVVPEMYTCKGKNISPELMWSDPPAGTQSLVLIVEDPDAPHGTYTHWVVYNIPARTQTLPANFSAIGAGDGLMQGSNDFGKASYGGPCPPDGDKPHRYYFRIYALDARLNLKPGASRAEVEEAMLDHIIGQGELMGKFQVN
jgi:Raf kinase inhibitor-like YbhB/YbcL family protein